MADAEKRDGHLTREVLADIALGRTSWSSVLPAALRHLFALCPHCQREMRGFVAQVLRREGEGEAERDLQRAFERAAFKAEGVAVARSWSEDDVEERLQRLLAEPADHRAQMVEDDPPAGIAAASLAERLVERSLSCLPGRPDDALALAELALQVAVHAPSGAASSAVLVRAKAHVGNALRALGRLRSAAAMLREARFLLGPLAQEDPLLDAELASFTGSLERDRRQFPLALGHLERALEIYTELGMRREAVTTLLKLATVHCEGGSLPAAIEVTREVLRILDPDQDRVLMAIARHNLAEFLNEAGDPRAAREVLAADCDGGLLWPDASTQLRILWLEAKIAWNLGEHAAAESGLLAVRDGFLRRDQGLDAALACLGLAALYLEQGRTADVQRLAGDLPAIFAAGGVHREALACLLLVRETIERELLSGQLVAEVSRFLEAARRDPSLRFEPSN